VNSTAENPSLEGPHWAFVLDFYGRPGVAQACLALQDRFGVDVIMLLFALFVFQRDGVAVDESEIKSLDGIVASWRKEVVVPLREVRRTIKRAGGPESQISGSLLKQVADAAIASEQVSLALLAAQKVSGDRSNLGVLLDRIVAFYAKAEGEGSADELATLKQTLLSAAE
jgi:uncharacterized protein (TIGR02444 family)